MSLSSSWKVFHFFIFSCGIESRIQLGMLGKHFTTKPHPKPKPTFLVFTHEITWHMSFCAWLISLALLLCMLPLSPHVTGTDSVWMTAF